MIGMASRLGMRAPDGTDPQSLREGEFCLTRNRWWVFPPRARSAGALDEGWRVVEHRDGSISARPGIHEPGRFRGRLIRGRWVW